ncbi:MAG: hypothetical protein QW275_01380 [Candidatus Anstonellaceae archaeon]
MVGMEKEGMANVWCEEHAFVVVASSDGSVLQIPLEDGQASFQADRDKSYAIFCGNQSKVIGAWEGLQKQEKISQDNSFAFAAMALFVLFAIFLLVLAKLAVAGNTEFTKEIRGQNVFLRLKAGSRMERIKICDPLFYDSKEELVFELPMLEKGKEWVCSYECPGDAILPAKLKARANGKEIVLESKILGMDGVKPQLRQQESQRKPVPKATC